ncbi:MAG: methyltransferase domain-containing protein [Deltaproteobacteria bacterium]|nr:methyltransferase domain-containing protein [Deltaproteobacteria bacterium]MCK5710826.1 methyltransferase domain-containing protein [Deltaproteobacteria bacterium]
MNRLLEPELMIEPEQVSAYAEADFEEPHSNFIDLLKHYCSTLYEARSVLDLGCGPGDITFKLTKAFPKATIDAVDGSGEMLKFAEDILEGKPWLHGRINFIHSMIQDFNSTTQYDLIISNSLLHHIPEPLVFWNKIKELSSPETYIFIMDLLRPDTIEEAQRLRDLYVKYEPEILQRDFYNSLLAAFEVDEVREQLAKEDLSNLDVLQVTDRHLIVFGNI